MSLEKSKEVNYDASLDAEMEQRNKIEYVREDGEDIQIGDKKVGKIKNYKFKVLIRDKEALSGTLSREELDLIYRLYSNEGSNLTQRSVSRYFPDYTFQDFKRILRAFNVTKASSPFAPHIIEEKSTEELIQLTLQSKENDYLKKLEQDRAKLTEVELKKAISENFKLKTLLGDRNEILSEVIEEFDFKPFKFTVTNSHNKNKNLIICLSDIHMGAYISNEGTYDNPHNKKEIIRKLDKIINEIYKIYDINELIIMNLGDAVDGFNASTTRPSSNHILPQNMSNKEQAKNLIEVLFEFFNKLVSLEVANKIKFYSVGHSNHGGDFEFTIITGLCFLLERIGIETYVGERPMNHFKLGERHVVFHHGKDNLDQFKNFPLTIDFKTENYIEEYCRRNKIYDNILFLKGDLHQSATSFGKRIRYCSVASLLGSTTWTMSNFGFTDWGCNCIIIDNEVISEFIISDVQL